jgi:hypothetical protein
VYGDLAYAATAWDDIWVVCIADRTAPVVLGTVAAGGAQAMLRLEDRLYLARDSSGLAVVSVQDAERPVVLGGLDSAVHASGLYVSNDLLYVANSHEGLHLVSVQDPEHPTEVGFFSLPAVACVAVADRRAYVGAGNLLVVLDVVDPTAPVEVARLELPGSPASVAVIDTIVVLVTLYHGLFVVSVEDPARPAVLGALAIDGYGQDLLVDGDLAFVAAGGLHIVSLANPERPEVLSVLPVEQLAHSVARRGDVVYLSEGSQLHVLSVADLSSPVEMGRYMFGLTAHLASVGEYLAAGVGWIGVELLRVSDPTDIRRIDRFDTAAGPLDVAVSERLVFVADGDGGLVILRVVDE